MKNNVLVISTSLNPGSNSRVLARAAFDQLKKQADVEIEWLDLQEIQLPQCDGDAAYGHPNVEKVTAQVKRADAILMAVPIYNYSVSGAAKNLIELTGQAWNDKLVGFLCAAGGRASYMAVMGIAQSLMLDFRCLIIPRFVYADGSAFVKTEISDDQIASRLKELTQTAVRLAGALKGKSEAATANGV